MSENGSYVPQDQLDRVREALEQKIEALKELLNEVAQSRIGWEVNVEEQLKKLRGDK